MGQGTPPRRTRGGGKRPIRSNWGPRAECSLQRGNHELRRTHSVFAQLAGVSIPLGGLPLTCSPQTHERPQQKGARRDLARASRVPPGLRACPRTRPRGPTAPCQLPPPHPPPPQEDPPPHEEPPPQEWPPECPPPECPPPECPPPLPQDEPPLSPAHQLPPAAEPPAVPRRLPRAGVRPRPPAPATIATRTTTSTTRIRPTSTPPMTSRPSVPRSEAPRSAPFRACRGDAPAAGRPKQT